MSMTRGFRIGIALGGLALALSGALPPRRPLAADAVARVGDVAIPEAALGPPGRAEPADAETRRQRIESAIDEELLVQRAIELGLAESDPGIRKALARAAIDRVVREAMRTSPTERDLRAFHETHASLFRIPRRIRVRAISFHDPGSGGSSWIRAQEAATQLAAGLDFEEARRRFGDSPELPIANALLPEAALRRALGPALAEVALALTPGAVSAPLRAGNLTVILRVAEERTEAQTDFTTVRAQVESEWRRAAGDEALARLLATLRSSATIRRAAEAR